MKRRRITPEEYARLKAEGKLEERIQISRNKFPLSQSFDLRNINPNAVGIQNLK